MHLCELNIYIYISLRYLTMKENTLIREKACLTDFTILLSSKMCECEAHQSALGQRGGPRV